MLQSKLGVPEFVLPQDMFFWMHDHNISYHLFILGRVWEFEELNLTQNFCDHLLTLDPLNAPIVKKTSAQILLDPQDLIETVVLSPVHDFIDLDFKTYNPSVWNIHRNKCHFTMECKNHLIVCILCDFFFNVQLTCKDSMEQEMFVVFVNLNIG